MKRRIYIAAGLVLAVPAPALSRAQDTAHAVTAAAAASPVKDTLAQALRDYFAIFLTGDGGWTSIERGVSAPLIAAGVPVVHFSQLWYLLRRKSPDRAAADLARIIEEHRARWHRNSVIVIGYSRGAGIAPFAVNRLPAEQRAAVKVLVLLGAEHTAGFKLGLREMFTQKPRSDEIPVLPELRQIRTATLVCVYGEQERDTLCPELAVPAISVKMPGGHHFGGRYAEIGKRILEVVAAARGP